MLSKQKRLTTRDVQEVLSKGKSIHISTIDGQKSLISLRFLATDTPFRTSVVAPSSVAKKANQRNTLRRAVYRALQTLPTPKKGMALFFVRRIPNGALTPAFAEEVSIFLKKISA